MVRKVTHHAPPLIVVSGGTGRTALGTLRAALAQFPDCETELVCEDNVRSARKAIAIVKRAAEQRALIIHSLVTPSVRRALDTHALRLDVPCVDVLGPAITLVGEHLDREPEGRAGLLYEVHREQMDRMDAVDFTLAHDDGKRVWELDQADIVLVGASRTTKSVTCCYLAFRGIRAANVPLIPGQDPPKELLRLPSRHVIGLTTSAKHLGAIRQTRLDRISKLPVPDYADLRPIQRELMEIRSLMSKRRWRCIDVSYKATEEVASQLIEMIPTAKAAEVPRMKTS